MGYNIIYCKEIDDYIEDYLKKENAQLLVKSGFNYVVKIGQIEWRIFKIHDGQKARRAFRIKVDSRIEEPIVNEVIKPMLLQNGEIEKF